MAKGYIILDSGHNEKVSGKRSPNGKLKEWDWNNKVQKKLKARLEAHDIAVYLTNPNPSGKDEIGLTKRTLLANAKYKTWGKPGKCLFISLHGNASGVSPNKDGWCDPRGVEVFTAKNASSTSRKARDLVCNQIYNDIKAIDPKFKNRGGKVKNFTVIYKTIMPCILIEHAFYDNYKDYTLMMNNIDAFVEADVKAICKHFSITYKKPSSKPSTSQNSSVKYIVKVIYEGKEGLNIREKADFDSKIVGAIHCGEAYTIVEEKNGMGKLLSGAGWISISPKYVKKI